MEKHSMILLAGGNGSRMKSSIPKQYLSIGGKPILAHSLLLFEKSFLDEVILVVRKGDIEYCRKEYIEKYHLKKVATITEGGAERYLSVCQGLKEINGADYIWIHDGARPFLTMELLTSLKKAVEKEKAAVLGVRVKDTVKQTDKNNKVIATVPRQDLWNIQTPQAFSAELIKGAYQELMRQGMTDVTDDSMVVERMTSQAVTVVEGSYRNKKITTPEDLYFL